MQLTEHGKTGLTGPDATLSVERVNATENASVQDKSLGGEIVMEKIGMFQCAELKRNVQVFKEQ